MKNIIKNAKKGILLLALTVTMVSFANENSIYNVSVVANKTTLTINHVKEGNLLSLKNALGQVIASETIKTTGKYTREFDLSFLSNGNYMFEVDKGLEINEIPFSIKSGEALFNKNEEKVIYKPFIRVSADMVFVSKLAIDGEPLDIEILFTPKNSMNSTVVVSEKIKNKDKIERAYQLSSARPGEYQVILRTAGRRFEKKI
ncbi:hypothetical protein [Pseudotamlana carrageenivorans]|uniref:Uncharacterized protein n=1 Tax=Pseudotamlana carrageenivorans TaxID=2069432 RepID=A0A2I7SGL5_9FLAO|nr:hypothetical protein [Tamlana carrageenivorans]AUS05047.1 hypothetical protein C1A40_06005 [Tamlana carrageenivorans]